MIKHKLIFVLLIICFLITFTLAYGQDQAESIFNQLGIYVHGFIDLKAGARIAKDAYKQNASLLESRFQLDLSRIGDIAALQIRADFLYDDIPKGTGPDLEDGTAFFDLRETNIFFSPFDLMDIKIGRQILNNF